MMFSTRNIYRMAVLARKSEGEDMLHSIANGGYMQIKTVEREFDGEYYAKNASKILFYETIIKKHIAKLARTGVAPAKKIIKVRKGREIDFIKRVVKQAKRSEHKNADMLTQLYAAREVVEFCKIIVNMEKNGRKVADFILIEGWVAKQHIEIIKNKMKGHALLLEYFEPDDGPILLRNPFPINVFESITQLYPPMRYGTIDFTPIIMLTFPIIFGIMFANVIDGTVLMAIALYMYARSKNKFYSMMAFLGLGSIVMGIIFGEYPGGSPVINVYDNPIILLYIALGIGGLHIIIGSCIGIANKILKKEWVQALPHAGVILFILAGVYYLLSGILSYEIGAVALLLVSAGGIKSVSELPQVFGHIFSYARIFAISIAHSTIISAFGKLAGGMHGDTSSIIISMLIVLFGHALVLTVELLVAFIHTLRLHVLEFGTTFLETGASWFKPYKFSWRYAKVG